MKNMKIYYGTILGVLIIEAAVDFLVSIPFEYHLSFLIPFVFSIYLKHPNIEEYKKKQRYGMSFSKLLFNGEVYFNEKLPPSKFKDRLVLYLPSFIFFMAFCLIQLNFLLTAGFVLGMVVFEASDRLINKLS